jgi:Bacterial PH domain
MGGRVTRTSVLAILAVGAIAVVEAALFFHDPRHKSMALAHTWPPLAAALISIGVLSAKFLYERSTTSHFAIEDNVLVLGRKRYPLAGLTEVSEAPDVMSWAFRVSGNGGLGSIRGKYWSKRRGKFHAFLTDTANAVLLRWPSAAVAVSPADPEFFIHTVRKAAELR